MVHRLPDKDLIVVCDRAMAAAAGDRRMRSAGMDLENLLEVCTIDLSTLVGYL
jgi:hypothetical protein